MKKNGKQTAKKLLALALAAVMLLSLTACGEEKISFPDPTEEQLAVVRAAEQTPMRLIRSETGDKNIDYIYDETGRLIREEVVDLDQNGSSTRYHLEYTYEPQPDGTTRVTCSKRNLLDNTCEAPHMELVLDVGGKCISCCSTVLDENVTTIITNAYSYDAAGRVTGIQSEFTEQEHGQEASNRVFLLESTYEWNDNGQLSKIVVDDIGLRRICDFSRNQYGEVTGRAVKQEYIEERIKTGSYALRIGLGSALLIPLPRLSSPPDVFSEKREYAISYENDEDGRLARKTMYWVQAPHNTERIDYVYDEAGVLTGITCTGTGLDVFAQMLVNDPWKIYCGIHSYTEGMYADGDFSNMTTQWEVIPE